MTDKSIDRLIENTVPEERIEDSPYSEEVEPDLSRDLSEHKRDFFRQKLREDRDTHELRLKYSNRIFCLVCMWLACVVVSVFMSGFNFFGFKLSDTVLITFITSTTVSVLGLFIIVAKWMFPNNHKKINNKIIKHAFRLLLSSVFPPPSLNIYP